jgi:[histone H3]-dimethyl-L-lysine9 demethylase
MPCQSLNYNAFQQSLAYGKPLVITGLQHRIQGTWNPEYFVGQYGSQKITLIDCETESELKSTVADFFRDFGVVRPDKRIVKLKVIY